MGLYFEDLKVGYSSVSKKRTVTETDLVNFTGLSWDTNPVHTDEEFCKTTDFGTRIAHGALGLMIVTGLNTSIGDYDGTMVASLGIDDWRFHHPIRIGDTVFLRTTVIETRRTKNPQRGVVRRRMELVNQRQEIVQSGVFVGMVRTREA
jgi:acyl dehydratase